MNDHDAFLQAILAEPDDDSPRLVYSDWLEERGDPRAEFIRVQCALAKPEGTSRQRAEWREREQALLAEHRTEWVKPLRGFGKLLQFRRGFVERLTITADKFLARGEALFRLAPVRAIRIRETGGRINELAACPSLARLTALSLTMNYLASRDMRILANSVHLNCLAALDLSSNRIGQAGVRFLTESPHLRSLTTLDIGNNSVSAAGVETLANWPGLARLSSLNLSFNNIGNPGLRTIAYSPCLTGLITLSLCLTQIADAGASALAMSPHLTRLQTLSLRRNHIAMQGARALADAPYFTSLSRLDLAGNDMGPEAQQLLKGRFGSRVSFT